MEELEKELIDLLMYCFRCGRVYTSVVSGTTACKICYYKLKPLRS